MVLSPFYSDSPDTLGYPVNITTVDGPTSVTWYDLDGYMDSQIDFAIIFGVRIGATAIFLICYATFSQRHKTPVFWMNLCSMLFLLIHSILFIVYLLGPFNSMSANFSGGYSAVTVKDCGVEVAANIFQMLIVISVLGSLLFQAYSLLADIPELRWWIIGALALFAALPVVVLYGIITVVTSRAVYDPTQMAILEPHQSLHWLVSTYNPVFAGTICLFTLLLSAKLLLAIRRRKMLGLSNFDPMRILFIVMVQTMTIPAIFSILQSVLKNNTPLSAISTMFVVLFLPFSSVWAQFQVNNSDIRTHAIFPALSGPTDKTPLVSPFLTSAETTPTVGTYPGLSIHARRVRTGDNGLRDVFSRDPSAGIFTRGGPEYDASSPIAEHHSMKQLV
jgi:pheromone alpha factor receptor